MGLIDWIRGLLSGESWQRERKPAPPSSPVGNGSRYVVIDVETTGLSPKSGRILELAMITLNERGQVVDEFVTRLNPEGPVGATHIHGIRDRDVANAPRFAQVLPDVMRILRGAAVVAHNAPFDLAFLRSEFNRAGWKLPFVPALCTLQASHYYLPDLPRRTLSECCRASGVRHGHQHSALGDARATAALLARFLDPRVSPHVRPDDTAILQTARGVRWPDSPAGVVGQPASTSRPQRFTPPKPASKALVEMVSRFSLLQAADAGASPSMVAYLEKLTEALEDGVLTDEETMELSELAEIYEFSPDDIAAANRSFLLALAHEALQDGKVARAERDELKHLAGVLNVDDKLVTAMLKRAEKERIQRLSEGLKPLPADWVHGEPLRVGDRVVMTGGDELERALLEEESERRGVRVMTGVSRTTTLLVSDGSFEGTKAAAAKELGTRTVTPSHYRMLLDHLQPAN